MRDKIILSVQLYSSGDLASNKYYVASKRCGEAVPASLATSDDKNRHYNIECALIGLGRRGDLKSIAQFFSKESPHPLLQIFAKNDLLRCILFGAIRGRFTEVVDWLISQQENSSKSDLVEDVAVNIAAQLDDWVMTYHLIERHNASVDYALAGAACRRHLLLVRFLMVVSKADFRHALFGLLMKPDYDEAALSAVAMVVLLTGQPFDDIKNAFACLEVNSYSSKDKSDEIMAVHKKSLQKLQKEVLDLKYTGVVKLATTEKLGFFFQPPNKALTDTVVPEAASELCIS